MSETGTVDAAKIRVAVGATWLDYHYPGWWRRINLESLDMWSPYDCILSQLTNRDFWHFRDEQGRELRTLDMESLQHFVDRGFIVLDAENPNREYRMLTAAWRGLILSRRGCPDPPAPHTPTLYHRLIRTMRRAGADA